MAPAGLFALCCRKVLVTHMFHVDVVNSSSASAIADIYVHSCVQIKSTNAEPHDGTQDGLTRVDTQMSLTGDMYL